MSSPSDTILADLRRHAGYADREHEAMDGVPLQGNLFSLAAEEIARLRTALEEAVEGAKDSRHKLHRLGDEGGFRTRESFLAVLSAITMIEVDARRALTHTERTDAPE